VLGSMAVREALEPCTSARSIARRFEQVPNRNSALTARRPGREPVTGQPQPAPSATAAGGRLCMTVTCHGDRDRTGSHETGPRVSWGNGTAEALREKTLKSTSDPRFALVLRIKVAFFRDKISMSDGAFLDSSVVHYCPTF
jgi:hypothetical protein